MYLSFRCSQVVTILPLCLTSLDSKLARLENIQAGRGGFIESWEKETGKERGVGQVCRASRRKISVTG
jgi:hypothetical protein